MSEESRPRVTRADYPDAIASDDTIRWYDHDEEDAGELGFSGELPDGLIEEPEAFAEQFELEIIRHEWSPFTSAMEIAVDFGVGTYYEFRHSDAEEFRTVVLRALPRADVEQWLDANWWMADLVDEQEGLVEEWFSGFEKGPHVPGELVIILADYEYRDLVKVVSTADGRFALNGDVAGDPRVLVVDSLAEVHRIAHGPLSRNFTPTLPMDRWAEEWEALDG